jgi:DNA-binding transcriptional LysR family regulator
MDRLLANQLFCRVVELGSFSAAAREARLPQPSVSRMIAALEGALGRRLLERTTRRVAATLDGRAYYAHVAEAVRTLQHAETAARSGFAELAGHVRVAVPGALGRRLLVPELRVDISASDQPLDLIGGNFDFAVRVALKPSPGHVVREIASSPQWWVGSPRYLAMRGTPSTPLELRGHHLVLRGQPPRELHRLELLPRMLTDEIETAYVAALAGIGLSILPRWLVTQDVKEGRLMRLLPESQLPSAPVVATYPSAKRLRKPARHVLTRLSVTLREALAVAT